VLKFEFQIDKSGPRPTVREAMAFEPSSHDKVWIKFQHDFQTGTFVATAPKYPSLKVSGKNFEDCCVQFQKAYSAMISDQKKQNGK